MERLDSVLVFSVLFLGLLILLMVFFRIHEKRKKKEIKEKFKTFRSEHDLEKNNLRAIPRILIPESIDVFLNLSEEPFSRLKASVIDISLTGILAESRFSLKKLPLNVVLKQVLVVTPINQFRVAELKLVRKEHRIKNNFLAFFIERINEDHFEELKVFLKYLDEFLTHDSKKN
ncbi:MAG: hypothetical protein KAS65_08640 [Candidatus Aminicenantes bacterium]|nr:hypothetical protein [Candidatus Aminicenantes bacterium]